jgi:hypothetical protein
MAERETLWGWDLDESPADVDDSAHSNGHHEPITEPIPVVAADHGADVGYDDAPTGYLEPTDYADESTGYLDEPTGDLEKPAATATYAGPFINSLPGSPISTLSFKAPPPPWFRTRKGLIAVLVLVAVALGVAIVSLVIRGADAGTEESPGVAPSRPAPSSVPTQVSVQPTLTSAPAPPQPPPPPPPPPEHAPPEITRQYSPQPRYNPPVEPDKPEVGVTRAPMSVAPQERTPPSTANPDGKPRRGFF